MSKFPSLSSKELVRLLEKGGVECVRQGPTDHAIYARIVDGRRYSAPVQTGKKTLDPIYCKRVLRQLKFSNEEMERLVMKKSESLLVSERHESYTTSKKFKRERPKNMKSNKDRSK